MLSLKHILSTKLNNLYNTFINNHKSNIKYTRVILINNLNLLNYKDFQAKKESNTKYHNKISKIKIFILMPQ